MRVVWLTLALCCAAPAAGKPSAWERTRTEDEIVVYRRDVPGTGLVSFKGVGVVDAPVDRLLSIVLGTTYATEWMSNLKRRQLFQMEPGPPLTFVEYNHIGMPWPVSDRDFVSRVVVRVDPETFETRVDYTPARMRVPDRGPVRGDVSGSYYILRPIDGGRRTLAIGVAMVDPKGAVPSWLVNLYQRNWPYDTLMALRTQVKRRPVKVLPELKPLYVGLGRGS